MARWEADSRGRLQRAALALYGERGFEQTTVAEIARRAGLTERTYFRHFADKREVLFWGSAALQELVVRAVADAPVGTAPIAAIVAALDAAAAFFQESREYSRRRQDVIDANPALQEREIIKLATLAAAVADALRGRGVGEPAASIAAEAGIGVFTVAFARWIAADNRHDFARCVHESLDALRAVLATG